MPVNDGAVEQIRTAYLILTKDVLYLLSYNSIYVPLHFSHCTIRDYGCQPILQRVIQGFFYALLRANANFLFVLWIALSMDLGDFPRPSAISL